MAQKRKPYAMRLEKDSAARKQIAILRMGGVPIRSIAKLTNRNVRTIITEVGRKEHKELIRQYVEAVGKKKLPETHAATVAKALADRTC